MSFILKKKMSEMRVSELHLKKELTQIRKAARVLRDPGTTSSWKSPLSSSRSVAAWNKDTASRRFTTPNDKDKDKDKRVFLYNWKNYKSSSEKYNDEEEEEDDDDDGSSSLLGDRDRDSLSDARNGCDSKSDTYLAAADGGGGARSSIFRCGDANLVSRRAVPVKKKSKKNNPHFDFLAKYQHHRPGRKKLSSSKALLEGHPSPFFNRDDSVEHSDDDTEDYTNSEGVRPISGTSPLLLKLRQKNWSRSSSKFLRRSRKEDSSYSYSTPALSTSSYNRYGHRYPSTLGSWDGTTTSVNDGDGDDEIDDHLDLPGRQGCGIPCYWSKRTPKHRGMCGSCYSPSLSDTLRRKGSLRL